MKFDTAEVHRFKIPLTAVVTDKLILSFPYWLEILKRYREYYHTYSYKISNTVMSSKLINKFIS